MNKYLEDYSLTLQNVLDYRTQRTSSSDSSSTTDTRYFFFLTAKELPT